MILQQQTAKEIFVELIGSVPPDQWTQQLPKLCNGDQDLLRRVNALLKAHADPGSFMEAPQTGIAVDPGPTTADTAAAALPGTIIGPYKLLEQIGEGGMGLVYMAEQQQPVRRLVALKLIKPGFDSKQTIARFEAEKHALAMMENSNIARVLDAGTTETGRPYFVMELVRGIPVNEFCDQKRLTVRERLELFVDVCQAVQHAHQKGIIHRDLKPTNVLVTMHDAVAVPKVIDFGIAKAIGPQLTEHTLHTGFAQLVGTPLYMSPEQAEMNQLGVDTRSDVYSLGVMLYEVLTGQTPFDKETRSKAGLDEMRRMIREDEPPRPSARVSTLEAQALSTVSQRRSTDPRRISTALRGELDWIVMKALEKDRSHRYESASAFAADIQRYLSDEPVQACPPSAAYRLLKFVRRNQSRVVAAGLAVALLAVVAIGGITTYSQRITTQRQIAQDVQQSLAAAKTAIEAGDLPLAEKRLAEANGRMGGVQRSLLTATADAVDKFDSEIAARRHDQDQFDKFIRQAPEAQDLMGSGGDLVGDRMAREALALYGVLTEKGWLAQLDESFITAKQKRQVLEVAYQTLVSMADYGTRWQSNWKNNDHKPPMTVEQALELLDRAATFHEPTRAFWFVSREAHQHLKNDQAAAADEERFKSAVAKSAWDHYLPGHTARWRGDLDSAMASYEAALRLQPDHYNSLFFLGILLASNKPERTPEAVVYFTAAIALRPNQLAYRCRAQCYDRIDRFAEAEADFSAAIAAAQSDEELCGLYEYRHDFYAKRGLGDKAREDLQTRITLGAQMLQKQRGSLSPDRARLSAMHNLSFALYDSDDLMRAISLADETLKLRREKLGADHPDTLNIMNCLALWHLDAGQAERAVTLAEEALELAKGKLGPEHASTLNIRNSLTLAYAYAGGTNQLIRFREEVLKDRQAMLSQEDWSTMNIMDHLASLYAKVGRCEEALSLTETTVRAAEAKFGPDAEETLNSRNNRADVYLAAARPELALPLLEKTLALAINKLGSDHDITLLTVLGLSIAHRKLAKTDEALRLGKQAYTALKAKRGMEYPYTLESVQNLAEVYRAAGKFDQAQALYQELFRDHPNALGVMADLGATLLTRHEYTEAEVLLRECLAASESHHPDAWKTFSRRSMLGAALAGQAHGLKAVDSTTAQDKLTEAEPLLLSGFEGLASRADTIPSYAKPRVTEALQRLVELYEIWDKPDEAAKWQKVLDANAALTAESGSNSPKPIYRDQMVVDLKQKTGR